MKLWWLLQLLKYIQLCQIIAIQVYCPNKDLTSMPSLVLFRQKNRVKPKEGQEAFHVQQNR